MFHHLFSDFLLSVASTTGIVLDPCYTAKAAKGLLYELNHNPEQFQGNRILFIHTGNDYNNAFNIWQLEKTPRSVVKSSTVSYISDAFENMVFKRYFWSWNKFIHVMCSIMVSNALRECNGSFLRSKVSPISPLIKDELMLNILYICNHEVQSRIYPYYCVKKSRSPGETCSLRPGTNNCDW